MGETDDLEWDDQKDAQNRLERSLPMVVGAKLFDGRPRLERFSVKSPLGEDRFETIASVDGLVLFCVWTWSGKRRRIISLRPAKRSERRAYEEATRRS